MPRRQPILYWAKWKYHREFALHCTQLSNTLLKQLHHQELALWIVGKFSVYLECHEGAESSFGVHQRLGLKIYSQVSDYKHYNHVFTHSYRWRTSCTLSYYAAKFDLSPLMNSQDWLYQKSMQISLGSKTMLDYTQRSARRHNHVCYSHASRKEDCSTVEPSLEGRVVNAQRLSSIWERIYGTLNRMQRLAILYSYSCLCMMAKRVLMGNGPPVAVWVASWYTDAKHTQSAGMLWPTRYTILVELLGLGLSIFKRSKATRLRLTTLVLLSMVNVISLMK